jgi:hypothetical protein
MLKHGDTLDRIAAVYAAVARDHPRLPNWNSLDRGLREALINAYFKGRTDLLAEQEKPREPGKR